MMHDQKLRAELDAIDVSGGLTEKDIAGMQRRAEAGLVHSACIAAADGRGGATSISDLSEAATRICQIFFDEVRQLAAEVDTLRAKIETQVQSVNRAYARRMQCRSDLKHCQALSVQAIELAVRYGGIEGEHHKAWVIDQMVRTLAGDQYATIVAKARAGEDGPETYEWNKGVAP